VDIRPNSIIQEIHIIIKIVIRSEINTDTQHAYNQTELKKIKYRTKYKNKWFNAYAASNAITFAVLQNHQSSIDVQR